MTSQQIILNVEGMSCHHCSGMVQRTLESIEGITGVQVDLNGRQARFDVVDPRLVDKAIQEINEAGYKASRS